MNKSNICIVTIPGYTITELIYASKKTTVYRGQQQTTQISVIIKILNAEYPRLQDLIAFKNQFAISQQIDHPNIIKCYALEKYGNSYAIILEDFSGISLSEYTSLQKLDINSFMPIAIAITKALEFLYAKKIIHKDIKPRNILINPQTQEIKLIDFGISSLLPKETADIKSPNVLSGTLTYMSPEQTGRMNRGIDYRTDFYSLGVTFYELLTGQLPFYSQNHLELVYCHIAKEPTHPREINPQIPPVLANIIIKLMAKNPDNRYQTARGIRYDLEICQKMLLTEGEINNFELAKRDISDRFLIHDKLYGREQEIITLLNAFESISAGNKELMLVAGFSGIGKTAVVNEVHKPIVRQKGYFISGKYDQFQKNIPFSALVQALRSLMRQLLTENIVQLQEWKTQILSALGEQGQVIIDVIPELQYIIGQQPPVTELTGNASENRFNLLFSKFIQVLATSKHPLVIFLDDLQWADIASLKLIKLLMCAKYTKYLLLIGAYRDNEINPGHPLILTLDDIRQDNITINQIILQALDKSHLRLLVKDTLCCPESDSQDLTELLLKTTQGNPFFANQLLKSLHEDGLITFNFSLGYWQCDINAAKALYHHHDIVNFLKTQLQKLPRNTQDILKIAACIGNQFDLATLSIVCEKSQIQVAAELWNALQEELIIPQNEAYKFFTDEQSAFDIFNLNFPVNNTELIFVKYKFLHDRVQQAAYALISDVDKSATHLKIGQLLLKNTNAVELEEKIFEIVNQLNIGIELITNQLERYELAKLNLIAGCKAKSSTAYEAAVKYLSVGLQLLDVNSWEYDYELTLNLYVESVEAEYLNINPEQAITYIEIVRKNATSILDQVKVYKKQMLMYDMESSIYTGLKLLEMLGVTLEQVPPENVNIEDLISLPKMIDPYALAAMGILVSLSLVAYISNPSLVLPIIFTMIYLSSNYGNSAESAYGYIVYGFILCDTFADIDTGYRYGKLAFNLSDKFDSKVIRFRVVMLWYCEIMYWKQHFRESILPLQDIAHYGWEIGETDFLGSCCTGHVFMLLFAGENLVDVYEYLEYYLALISHRKLDWHTQNLKIWQQIIFNLINVNPDVGINYDKCKFNGDFLSEELFLFFVNTKNYNSLFGFYLTKTIQFYLFYQYKNAVDSAILAKPYIAAVTGQVIGSEHNFYYSLALLAEYPYLLENEQLESMQEIISNQQNMQDWAIHAPMNYQHKYQLIEAEKARVLGNNWQAMELYDQAITGAKENKYLHEEALANELAAKFYLSVNKEKIAKTYLIDAYYCYANWGAKAKIQHLEKTYPHLLETIINQTKTKLTAGEVSTLISKPSLTGVSALLDLETVTKASLAIASEIQIDKLLYTLMQVISENVAANKSALILQKEGNLILVAQCMNEHECKFSTTPINDSQDLPSSIINYVANMQEYLLISDATNDQDFANDSYIIQHQSKSILCNPILNKGQLIGILYLENNLTVGAFTIDRLRILNLLSSQAAISLENAQLYSNLEEKVTQRTQELNENNLHLEQTLHELKATQSQLIQTEKMSSLGRMVAGIAHEINNPINFIYANIEHASNYTESIINLLNIYQQEYPSHSATIEKYKQDNDFDFVIQDLPRILDSMTVGSERIRKIILSLRNFSRLDESEMKPVDIHEGIDSTLMILETRFQEKLGYSRNVVIKNYSNLPLVQCYASQLNQVFMNIISNAIDVLKQREKSLSTAELKNNPNQIIIRTQIINNNWVQIAIKDNGMGIKPEIKQRIFDPFFTTKPVGEGTGLGLSISYQIIVDKHSGKLDCISAPGKGTEFIIEIPIKLHQP
ncbi:MULTISPECIES: ATP-binding sensor histidine kinase [Nostocales]|uniref:AAA family ATPase n=1 Tax=Dolichospermum flos-aquae UHCC 0037 TaxID=2590026 RepID=A0ACC7S6U0_DOLFA|nr:MULTISPECIES: ATP-binding sensor histidine kinase [Nostocales]MBO1066947.1 AAA family ATPase [Anabaena sp. 54]MTJ44185.1 AAA family ATPase [Dolichospermum flos-aquae UHCC 0037]